MTGPDPVLGKILADRMVNMVLDAIETHGPGADLTGFFTVGWLRHVNRFAAQMGQPELDFNLPSVWFANFEFRISHSDDVRGMIMVPPKNVTWVNPNYQTPDVSGMN